MANHQPIAVVGLACMYPDARTPSELWDNVLAQRRAFRQLPDERLNAADYFSEDPHAADKTYVARGAVIEGYEFDRVGFRVAGSVFRSADLAHWLALDVASRALTDAGYAGGEGLPRETTGVVLGNSLTGEFSRANLMRLRWPYVRRVLESRLAAEGWEPGRRRSFVDSMEGEYKSAFPPVGEESLAGGLSNTIAGRICNHFDLKGGGYTIDGACSSSLLAVAQACSSVAAGDLDVALAGGVDLSLDPFEIVGFAKTGALAAELMRVYDTRSAGFWPGEGCGFVALMRLDDAIAEGRRIYAAIQGWGVSSDGSGGITRPEAEGQIQAMRRAYRRAGYGIDTVGYFEGHGTGTAVGDATELNALSQARREARADAPGAAIGSVKANIGHTKAAAGIAGLLKATMAVHTQTLPPMTGCETPRPELSKPNSAFRAVREAESWPADQPIRASVSAMGFGGINAHVTLEGVSSARRKGLNSRERGLSHSAQDAEMCFLGANDITTLTQEVDRLLSFAARVSFSELTDLAAELAKRAEGSAVRAAIVASSPWEFAGRLVILKSWLQEGVTARLDSQAGVFLGANTNRSRIGFLFPGQGSPANLSGGIYRRRFAAVRSLYESRRFPADDSGIATEVAQPAIATASLAALNILKEWGVEASVGVGHSLGEIVALHWAGAYDQESLLRIAQTRGKAMADLGNPTGAMAAINAPSAEVAPTLPDDVCVVGYNSCRQTVIAGAASSVAIASERAQERGWRAVRLPVSHAFHTSLVAAAAPLLAEQLAREPIAPLERRVVSTVTGLELRKDEDITELLVRQVTSPVRFIDALTAAASECDLFIEVGPGQVLAGLARDTVKVPVVAVDACGASLTGLLKAVGAAFALGAPVRPAKLFEGRHAKPFSLDWKPKFFINPCETAPRLDGGELAIAPGLLDEAQVYRQTEAKFSGDSLNVHPAVGDSKNGESVSVSDLIRRLVADRAEFPVSAITDESRLLSDLHLNSITVGQLVAEAASKLNLPPILGLTDFATATVGRVAQALEEVARSGSHRPGQEAARAPDGIDAWVRPFVTQWVEAPLPDQPKAVKNGHGSHWQIISPPDHPLEGSLANVFREAPGTGVVVCLPSNIGAADAPLLLKAARAALAQGREGCFVLVQEGPGSAGFAKTLYLESPATTTRIVELPFDHSDAAQWVLREALSSEKYSEARYDRAGTRREPRLCALAPSAKRSELPLGASDVLLVTGGAKGIGAECALALARRSGAKLALLGRSAPSNDPEVAANLERMMGAGVRCRYYIADVTDASAVKAAAAEIERELGAVSAVLHAAGSNTPQAIASLDETAFCRTLAPKIDGARNVLATIDPARLRLFIAFGSIIGRAGLQGEADYAVANDLLTALTEGFAQRHPQCRCLSIEWSVWSGVGMGARLGRIESLRQQGITPISPERGVELLEELLTRPLPHTAIVAAGRYGELPTLRLAESELPLLRFLEKPKVFYPGVELIADSVLTAETDPYIEEHAYHGERLFPAVMGLEAMAQAAMALMSAKEPPGFEKVALLRPVVVPKGGRLTVRVAALRRVSGEIEVALRTEETAFKTDHFRAICRFTEGAGRLINSEPEVQKRSAPLSQNGSPLDIAIDSDLYDDLLFHTGRFRRVKNYRMLRAKECLAQIEPDIETPWFGRYLSQDRVLGDTGVRDAAIHAIQACIPHAQLLPAGVEDINIGRLPCLSERARAMGRTPELFLHAKERRRDGDTFYYDVELLAEDGSCLEKWDGLRLKKVADIPRKTPWSPALLGPYIERRIEDLLKGAPVSIALARGISGDDAIRLAVGFDVPILRRADGKPERTDGGGASVAHSGDITMAATGPGAVGCDIEQVSARGDQEWRSLLGQGRFELAQMISREVGEHENASATRIWTAIECLKKAGCQSAETPLTLDGAQKDGWILLKAGSVVIASYIAQIKNLAQPLAIGVLATCASRDNAYPAPPQ